MFNDKTRLFFKSNIEQIFHVWVFSLSKYKCMISFGNHNDVGVGWGGYFGTVLCKWNPEFIFGRSKEKENEDDDDLGRVRIIMLKNENTF